MPLTIEQVVTRLKREVITLTSELSIKLDWQMQHAPKTIMPLRKSGITCRGSSTRRVGRLKEFTGNEEYVQPWSEKSETFAGTIKVSEIWLEWSAERSRVRDHANRDEHRARCAQLGACAATDAYCLRGWHKATRHCGQLAEENHGSVATTAGTRRSDDRMKTAELATHDRSCERCSLLELHGGIKRWEPYVARYKKNLEDTLDG